MSKSYKKQNKQKEEIVEVDKNTISKKELYDLEKKKKLEQKEKKNKKKDKKKKKKNRNTYSTNLAGRIFAIVMLILMIGSVVASIAAYVR